MATGNRIRLAIKTIMKVWFTKSTFLVNRVGPGVKPWIIRILKRMAAGIPRDSHCKVGTKVAPLLHCYRLPVQLPPDIAFTESIIFIVFIFGIVVGKQIQ